MYLIIVCLLLIQYSRTLYNSIVCCRKVFQNMTNAGTRNLESRTVLMVCGENVRFDD